MYLAVTTRAGFLAKFWEKLLLAVSHLGANERNSQIEILSEHKQVGCENQAELGQSVTCRQDIGWSVP